MSTDGLVEVPQDDAIRRKLISIVEPENINCLLNFDGEQYLFEDIPFPDGWDLFRQESLDRIDGDSFENADYFRYIYNFDIDLGDAGTTAATIDIELNFVEVVDALGDSVDEVASFDDLGLSVSCPIPPAP